MDPKRFVSDLLAWYEKFGWDYPWRSTANPYKVLFSEVFLQRTKADQVLPVYKKFVKMYPDINSLAQANIEDLRKIMYPLGLEKKVETVSDLAKAIMNSYGGKIPSNKKDLEELPGVGPYIRNAVLCFAFDIKAPLVDRNVYLVYNTVFGLESEKERPTKDKKIWNFARAILPNTDYRDYNYGLIDLGRHLRKNHDEDCECPLNREHEIKGEISGNYERENDGK